MKMNYLSPRVKIYDVEAEGDLLVNSVNGVESMDALNGSWDEDDD